MRVSGTNLSHSIPYSLIVVHIKWHKSKDPTPKKKGNQCWKWLLNNCSMLTTVYKDRLTVKFKHQIFLQSLIMAISVWKSFFFCHAIWLSNWRILHLECEFFRTLLCFCLKNNLLFSSPQQMFMKFSNCNCCPPPPPMLIGSEFSIFVSACESEIFPQ